MIDNDIVDKCTYMMRANISFVYFLIFMLFPVSMLTKSDKAGNDEFYLGYKGYLNKDFKTALLHWKPLAEAGNSAAQYQLGHMFLNGQGVTEDWAKAGKWFRASAK